MTTGLYFELKRLAAIRRQILFQAASLHPKRQPQGPSSRRFMGAVLLSARFIWIPAVLTVGFAAWVMPSGPSVAEDQALNAASYTPSLDVNTAMNALWFNPAITPTQASLATPSEATFSETPAPAATNAPAIVPPEENAPADIAPEAAPVDGLKIASQSWHRGGLGSNAQITFTLQNANDYAVKDVEIACAFARRDGSHLTDRDRVIHDTINMKSRKTFARMHIGFVNVNASKAKCTLVAADRI